MTPLVSSDGSQATLHTLRTKNTVFWIVIMGQTGSILRTRYTEAYHTQVHWVIFILTVVPERTCLMRRDAVGKQRLFRCNITYITHKEYRVLDCNHGANWQQIANAVRRSLRAYHTEVHCMTFILTIVPERSYLMRCDAVGTQRRFRGTCHRSCWWQHLSKADILPTARRHIP